MKTASHSTILHVDMDAFYASVEQNDHPEYMGKPLVVGAPRDKRGVVSAASYEARKFGIHSAMPSREAARLCPEAIFRPVNMARYKEVSSEIFSIFDSFTPYKEPLSLDEAFLDVTGSLDLFGDGVEIAQKIKTLVKEKTGLTASVGVACNKFLAKIASDLEKPDGLTVVPSEPEKIKQFLAPLDIGRIWGVGKVTRGKLEQKGLLTIGHLQSASPERLAMILGEHSAERISALVLGRDERTIETCREQKSYSREHTFDKDCSDVETLERALCAIVEDVASQIRAAGRYAKTGHLKLRWKGFKTITRQKQFVYPSCDDTTLRELAFELFNGEKLIAPVRLIGFGVRNLVDDADRQGDLFDDDADQRRKRENISRTVDDIRKQFGEKSISSARTL